MDWPVMKGAALLLIISMAVSASLLGSSHYFAQRSLREFTLYNGQARSISNQYLSIEQEEKLIQQYLPPFIALYRAGILGKERRLRWLEALNDAGQALNIPSLAYDISAQQVYRPDYQVNLGQYQLFASMMTLQLNLLHEADLFRLLQALDDAAPGLFTVSACELRRSAHILSDDASRGNISASCDLLMLTIRPANGEEIEV